MIDARFSRDRFESLPSYERKVLAAELAVEITSAIASIPTADGAVSSVLSRLRLVGHHLYPVGEGRFEGTAEPPTGLVIEFGPHGVEARYR